MTGGWNLFRGKMSWSCMIRMIVMIMIKHDGDINDDGGGDEDKDTDIFCSFVC